MSAQASFGAGIAWGRPRSGGALPVDAGSAWAGLARGLRLPGERVAHVLGSFGIRGGPARRVGMPERVPTGGVDPDEDADESDGEWVDGISGACGCLEAVTSESENEAGAGYCDDVDGPVTESSSWTAEGGECVSTYKCLDGTSCCGCYPGGSLSTNAQNMCHHYGGAESSTVVAAYYQDGGGCKVCFACADGSTQCDSISNCPDCPAPEDFEETPDRTATAAFCGKEGGASWWTESVAELAAAARTTWIPVGTRAWRWKPQPVIPPLPWRPDSAAQVDDVDPESSRRWTCTASCNVQQVEWTVICPDRVYGGPVTSSSQSEACRLAKADANAQVPAGCYKRHCQCSCA